MDFDFDTKNAVLQLVEVLRAVLPSGVYKMATMTQAYVSLGSNMKDAVLRLEEGLTALAALPGVVVAKVSPCYLTEPQGYKEQAWFANCVARLDCTSQWTAPELLRAMLVLETRMGRVRSADPALRFGPRSIDLDLLLFGDEHREDVVCTLPHPRMHERAFVLVPLQDIAPQVIIHNGQGPGALLALLNYTVKDGQIAQP